MAQRQRVRRRRDRLRRTVAGVVLLAVIVTLLTTIHSGSSNAGASRRASSTRRSAASSHFAPWSPTSWVASLEAKVRGQAGHLQPGSNPSVLPGPILIADRNNSRLLLVDPKTNQVVWQYGVTGVSGSAPATSTSRTAWTWPRHTLWTWSTPRPWASHPSDGVRPVLTPAGVAVVQPKTGGTPRTLPGASTLPFGRSPSPAVAGHVCELYPVVQLGDVSGSAAIRCRSDVAGTGRYVAYCRRRREDGASPAPHPGPVSGDLAPWQGATGDGVVPAGGLHSWLPAMPFRLQPPDRQLGGGRLRRRRHRVSSESLSCPRWAQRVRHRDPTS